jgi:branched-chain amino acid transport system substrate-binding protein
MNTLNLKLSGKIASYFLILLILAGCHKIKEPAWENKSDDIKIGVLIDLTGSAGTVGENSQASLQLAKSDIQSWLFSIGMDSELRLIIEDTRTDTAAALEKLKELSAQGIRMVIGPYSSPELAHVKQYADEHDILLVSPASVIASLAVAGDNIFRYIPSDLIQTKATAALLTDDGIKWVVPVVRNDIWGNELLQSAANGFTAQGGGVAEALKYSISGSDIPEVVKRLDEEVGKALLAHPAQETGVYMLSYAEGTTIMNAAGKMENLKKVRWYGSSAFGMNKSILADPVAADFAISRGLPCTMYGLDESARHIWEPLKARITDVLGRQPDAYAMASYDALWVLAKTALSLGSDERISRLKIVFTEESNRYFGASGNTWLNEAGDRAFGNYDFWGVQPLGKGYEWKRLAWYNTATGTLVRL